MSVSENSDTSPSTSFDFHDVDYWAVTYPDPNLPTIKFRWSIRNFLQIYSSTDKISSPLFEGHFEGKGGIGNKWQIRLRKQCGERTGREFLSVHLYLASTDQNNIFRVETIPARFQVCILESNGSAFRRTAEEPQFQIFKERSGWGYNNFCLVDHFRTMKDRLLPGGNLLITCEIKIEKPTISVEGRGGVRNDGQTNKKSMSRLASDFRALLHGGTGSDFTIYVVHNLTRTKFAVHKVVLAARSKVFKAMFTFPGSQDKSITIEDFNYKVVAVMLEYMYTGMVNEKGARETVQDLVRIADYYNLDDLRGHCETILVEHLEVENAMDILAFADKFNCSSLKQMTVNFISCNKKEVMGTSGFKKVTKAQPNLIVDLYLS